MKAPNDLQLRLDHDEIFACLSGKVPPGLRRAHETATVLHQRLNRTSPGSRAVLPPLLSPGLTPMRSSLHSIGAKGPIDVTKIPESAFPGRPPGQALRSDLRNRVKVTHTSHLSLPWGSLVAGQSTLRLRDREPFFLNRLQETPVSSTGEVDVVTGFGRRSSASNIYKACHLMRV